MNLLKATISDIASVDNLNIVKFDFNATTLSMMSLELPEGTVIGQEVNLTVNPSYIALAKAFSGDVSYSNQIEAVIISVENGVLLSSIKLSVGSSVLESVITKESSVRLALKVGERVTMLIKASELSMMS